jgi:transposase-like protein
MGAARRSFEDVDRPGRRKRRDSDEWRELIKRHRDSGTPVSAFCREQGLSEQSFYAWRRRLGVLASTSAAAAAPTAAPTGFVRLNPVEQAEAASGDMIEVRFDCGATLRWPSDRLSELVRALADGGGSC